MRLGAWSTSRNPTSVTELPWRGRVVAHAALLLAACPFVHGCRAVDGGAVEASWVLRDEDGATLSCADAGIAGIQLWWEVDLGEGTSTTRFDEFPCTDGRGVTLFDLPVGDVALWLRPACEDSFAADESSFRAPPAIVRTITEGDVITLDTQLIEVRVTGCTVETPCICQQ